MLNRPKPLVPGEEKIEPTISPQVRAETKKAEIPSPKADSRWRIKQIDSKEAAKASSSIPGAGKKLRKNCLPRKKPVAAPKPPQEIVLKISDRDKAISQLRELVKQFKGEIVTTEGNRFLASLPASSFSEFEKELVGVSSTRPDG